MNSKVYLKQAQPIKIVIVGLLMLVAVLPVSIETAHSQTADSHYWVTVNSSTPSAVMYGTVGRNCTVSFKALWSYGSDSGKAIDNANITVAVKKTDGSIMKNVTKPTNTSGFATFYYSSSTPIVLTFTPTRLVTNDGVEWNSSLLDNGQNSVYGFQSDSIKIYWDTFDASLVHTNTNIMGVTQVSVNITYLLVPEGGLTLPSSSSQQIYHPKIAHAVNVTINGVKAEETTVEGIYAANFSTWLPTTYAIVKVSQEGWAPAHKGFSFTHNSNLPVWAPAIIFSVVGAAVFSALYLVIFRKPKGIVLFRRTSFPIIGGVLLTTASFISLYWGVVGFDSTLHGFDWTLLGICGVFSFGFGLAGSVVAMKRRKQALAIFAVCAPMLTNAVAIKSSLDAYQLATPWLLISPSLAVSILSGFLIANSDEQFLS